MSRLVFLLEESSMKAVVEGLLPRLIPGVRFICVPHEGKSDLEKSIPRKLRGWTEPGVRFIVVRDNDNGRCVDLKARLIELCKEAGRPDTLVRIVCQELESWYIGDLEAVALAFDRPKLKLLANKAKYRDPDRIGNPSEEMTKLVPEFQKLSGARRIAAHLDMTRHTSTSFRVFVSGVLRIWDEMSQENRNDNNVEGMA